MLGPENIQYEELTNMDENCVRAYTNDAAIDIEGLTFYNNKTYVYEKVMRLIQASGIICRRGCIP